MYPFQVFWRWIVRNGDQDAPDNRFVDLAPTGDAENATIYFEALDYAIGNDNVLNIALTGPYGSGKSSVIKSFLKRRADRQALYISLASFVPGDPMKKDETRQAVERSILQQILYGVDASKLPLSRFRRIRTPGRKSAIGMAAFITIGMFCSWYLFSKQKDILSGRFFEPWEIGNWFNFFSVGVVIAITLKIVHGIYLKSFGLSLKSISLKDVQIAPAAEDEGSILNRHLDEIIYFFQSTKYDLVVVEDLDRFENPDIFVSLREINGLINKNDGIRRRVKFVYATKDDLFQNTDRAKFFEFIVPIIPVINHSNSIDKIIEQGQRVELEPRLNRQFVRDVSRYISDLRLIRNIFNEYVVYSVNLSVDADDGLDPNKLLAVLIYKNAIPDDFAALHRQGGALATVLGRYEEYVSKIEDELRAEVVAIEANLASGEAQALRDEHELRSVYAMAVIERMPANHTILHTGAAEVPAGKLAQSSELERVLSRASVNSSGPGGRGMSALDLRDVQNSVDPTRTFDERKEEIERKSAKFKQNSERRLRELKSQLASLRTRKFNEVVRESVHLIDEVFAQVGQHRELLKFLILEGYLDDTYYQYISLFHSGRLSPNDNRFLIQIRSYKNPGPDSPIDNGAEVIASMRNEDFGHHYVLNRFIMDQLLEDNSGGNAGHLAAAIDFIATHFDECGAFFSSYYARGAHVDRLVVALIRGWREFPSVALEGPHSASHAARILAHSPQNDSALLPNGPLARFMSASTQEVLAERVEFDMERLGALGLQVVVLSSIGDFPTVVAYVTANGLYRVSVDNIRYVLQDVVGWPNLDHLEERHYSTLLETGDESLLKRVHSDFSTYVEDVLLKLKANTAEARPAIIKVLANDDVGQELREEFLLNQTAIFSSLTDVPTAFYPLVLEKKKVEPTWESCIEYLSSEVFDPQLLTAYLQDADTSAVLSRQPVPRGEAGEGLRKFLVENNDLSIATYKSYARKLPTVFGEFPDVDAAKLRVLIEDRKVEFNPATFESLGEDLQVLFIAENFAAYAGDESSYAIDDDFRAKLLGSGITDDRKLKVIGEMDQSFVSDTPLVAAIVGPILARSSIKSGDFGVAFIKAVVVNSQPERVQISLLNKLHEALSSGEVLDVLASLPQPYRDISVFGKSPKIENSDVNMQLASWLEKRNIISSFSETMFGDDIRVYTFKKKG